MTVVMFDSPAIRAPSPSTACDRDHRTVLASELVPGDERLRLLAARVRSDDEPPALVEDLTTVLRDFDHFQHDCLLT